MKKKHNHFVENYSTYIVLKMYLQILELYLYVFYLITCMILL